MALPDRKYLALGVAPLSAPIVFVFFYMIGSASISFPWVAFAFMVATLVSYIGSILIGLPSLYFLSKTGYLNTWTVLGVGLIGGAFVGVIDATYVDSNQAGLGPVIFGSIAGLVVAATYAVIARLPRTWSVLG